RLLDRRSPHSPPLDESAAYQQLDQRRVQGTYALEGGQLLEVVGLAVEHIRLRGIRGYVRGERVPQLVGGLEPRDKATRLHERVLAPPAEDLARHLRLAASPSLSRLLCRERRGGETPEEADRQDRGGNRSDRGPINRRDQQGLPTTCRQLWALFPPSCGH